MVVRIDLGPSAFWLVIVVRVDKFVVEREGTVENHQAAVVLAIRSLQSRSGQWERIGCEGRDVPGWQCLGCIPCCV